MTLVPERVVVIGGGVAGVVSAYLLQQKYDVTLLEKNDYVGGHTNTIRVENGPDEGTMVDTGFIVLNDRTYPNFRNFLERLKVPVRDSDMSFGFYNEETGLQYAGSDLSGLFAQRQNLLKVNFWRMILDIHRFGKEGIEDLKKGAYESTLGAYVKAKGFSQQMIDEYLLPMGSAIWSTPPGEIWDFPTETFLKFFLNHGLLDLSDRPQWQTVQGGSQSYVKVFLKEFTGKVQTHSAIRSITRKDGKVQVKLDRQNLNFEKVIIATHADEALHLLGDPTAEEKRLLGVWSYQRNHTVLHTDTRVLPPNKRAWASWNYIKERGTGKAGKTSLTYDMNRLQGLKTREHYCVTLNRAADIEKSAILKEFNYTHTSYPLASVATQSQLPQLNGVQNTYFCGSYFGFGFHEDAVKSAVAVGLALGVSL